MHLIMILVICIILFGSKQAKSYLWGIIGLVLMLAFDTKLFFSILFLLFIIGFIIACFNYSVENDSQKSKVNNQESLDINNLADECKEQPVDNQISRNETIYYETESFCPDVEEIEQKNDLNTKQSEDFNKFIKDYGIPTRISIIDGRNSLAFYKNLDLIVIYNHVTNQIIKKI